MYTLFLKIATRYLLKNKLYSFIILILSWLNYVNLSTTKTLERAREVGIRKVSGAQKPQLIMQSLLESSLLNVVSIVIGIVLVVILLPTFNQVYR